MLIIAGIVGIASSFILILEKLELAKNLNHQTSCDLSPFVSCGSVMASWQATLFGFPNQLLGFVAFTIILVTASLVVSTTVLPKWYWMALYIGTSLGMIFIVWLWSQSLYSIGALCLYCMAVWSVMIPLFTLMTRYMGNKGYLGKAGYAVGSFLDAWWWVIVSSLYLLVIATIFLRFDFYWIPMIESLFS